MASSCSYIPRNKQGEELKGFQTYKKELGYKTAAQVFTQVIAPSFKEDYKRQITLDEQGIPTYDSVSKIPYVKNLIGNTKLMTTDQKQFGYVDNTRENYRRLLQSAYSYNQNSDNRDRFVAVVTSDDNGLRVEIRDRTEANVSEYENQYSSSILNKRLIELLKDFGVDISLLERNEGTNGFVDFSKASSIADGFAGLINIANGMEGEVALSEEFAHLLIGMFRDTPLVQRSLNQLASNEELVREVMGEEEYDRNYSHYWENPNYDREGNQVPINETMAEEALGKILQEKLKTSTVLSEENSKTLDTLITRLINWLKKLFKGRNAGDFIKAKTDASTAMGELAKNILNGSQKLSKEELAKNRRNARFNQLSENTDRVLKLLRNANEIERKRVKISSKEKSNDIKTRIIQLEALMTDAKKMEGLHTYAKWALKDLQDAMEKLNITDSLDVHDFKGMRHIKNVLDSYEGFIDDFHKLLDELDECTITVAGEEVNLRDLWRDIADLYRTCDDAFKKQAFGVFSDFLAPIYEKSPLRNPDGSVKPLEEVLVGQEFDISEFDRWCTSMGTSSSLLLQLFGKAVQNAKEDARQHTIHSIRDIWALREKAEREGITDFEWMYEKDSEGHKTGNYISMYNHGQFEKDYGAFKEELKEKYGERPTGDNFIKYHNERKSWLAARSSSDFFGKPLPGEYYRNKEYSKLSQTQKELLEEILNYKDQLEMFLPADIRSRLRAIQRRRSGMQRLIDSAANPIAAFDSVKEDFKSAFTSSEDDDLLYGSTKGLTDFTGQEFLTLPVLYTTKLKNPDTLSTDIFSDLMTYAYMANTYAEMNKIYDPLEIGVTVVSQKDFVKNSGTKIKEEALDVLGRITKKPVKVGSNTNFAKKLRDYLECQVYGRYLKEDDVFGKKTQKAVGIFQRLTSLAYLGCNWLAGVANVATAAGMQNIEAAAGEFFGAKELGKADAEYMNMLPAFVAELGSRSKQSELALFDELFDVKQNAKDKVHNTQMNNIFRRFFGTNWLFIQQGMGDHWIYNRTAIAMAKKKKILVNGKEMSVWDAREIVEDKNGYKYMKIKDGAKNLDGSDFLVRDFTREIAHINHTIAGIYNDDDQNAANRVMTGRLAQQMRKWILPQFMRRFQSRRMIMDISREEEGYYRTFLRLSKDVWKSGFKISSEWDRLSASDKANIRRALTEMSQTLALFVLVNLLSSGAKDPDRIWAAKFAEYMANRELHELGFLTLSPYMLTEGYKTITSPFVAASAANKLAQAVQTTANPWNWFPDEDELIQSGMYEGHSHIYKRWREVPLPPMTQFKQLDKFFNELETGTKYYSRDYK